MTKLFKLISILIILIAFINISVAEIPNTPVSLTETHNSGYPPFWVNWTWLNGSGNLTDGYNITISNLSSTTWFNGTNNYYNLTEATTYYENTIKVYAYNNTGNGNLSLSYVSDSYRTPCPSGFICTGEIIEAMNIIWSLVTNIGENIGSLLTLIMFGIVISLIYIFRDFISEMFKAIGFNNNKK